MVLGAVVGFALTLADSERYWSFVPGELAQGRDPTASTEHLREGLVHRQTDAGDLAAFSTFLFTHNAKVGMLAFALGFAAGVPTILLLVTNGLVLGAFAALYHARGLSVELWAWLLPHGGIELGAVALCGGAGLVLAESLVFPGRHGRVANLGIRGREAAVVFVGATVLLLVAALVEGIFRQTVQDVGTRYAVAAATGGGALAYFALVGRGRR
jgi:uncharacterized membrane protein SpoIIM required for sporulation